MHENAALQCPECENPESVHRRTFLKAAGGAAVLALTGAAGQLPARDESKPAVKAAQPADELIKELCSTLSDDQKKTVCLPWEAPERKRFYNSPINKRLGECYTKPQQELLERILKAMTSDDDGWKRMSRAGTWDQTGGFISCGANIFGDPGNGKNYALVFTGHHLTMRFHGDSEEGAAFGGPLFYGHSPNGYSDKNVFFYQTKEALSVFDALTERQRNVAVLTGTPGEGVESVKFKKKEAPKPGLSYGEMNKDQQALVEKVMRSLLSPYRKEDADEVMMIVKANGGLEKLHMAFYQDMNMNDNMRWHFWRIEGPGFVWNFRVLPHVHTYVNISSKI
jgi:Protein of unknown function (DUF3500)